jgi:hypothetical protein
MDQEIRDLEVIHQQVQRKKEKMAWLANLQKKINEAAQEMRHLTQDDYDRRPQHRELRQESSFNEEEWYDDFHHGNFAFDDVSPLAVELQATPWPPAYKPPQLPMYDGHSDPKQFLMSYKANISSYGGNTAVMVKSFVMEVKNVAQTWYSSCWRFDPGGSLNRRVNYRRVSQPRWVGARRSMKGGRNRQSGNPRPSCCPAPRSGALAVGGYKRSRGRERERGPYAPTRSPMRPTSSYESPGPSFYRHKERV